MTRSIALASLIGLALLLPSAGRAERLGKGSSLVLVGIGGHRGESISVLLPILSFSGAVFPNESGEVGGEIAYHRFLDDQWTIGISGGYYASRMKSELADPSGTDMTDTRSFTMRIGGDRYAFIDDNVALYAGPGIFFARGRWKSRSGNTTIEGPDATEVGLSGRIGVYARLGKGWALVGHIGQVLSRTSGKNSLGKVSWWSSTHHGFAGLAFDL